MVPTKISNTFQTSIEQISRTQITNKPFPPIVRLTVEIEIIGTLSEVLIFINAINTSEFSIDDPAFIGAATFFGGNHNGEHNHQPGMTMEGRSQSFYFDVTETIQKLSQADRFTNLKGASVTVAPVIPEDNSLGITGEIKLKSFKFEIVY